MKYVRNLSQKLPILVLFLFFSCTNESLLEEEEVFQQSESMYKISAVFKEHIQTNMKLNTKMRRLTELTYNSASEHSYNAVHDFTINTDFAKFVESTNSNNHSYTFTIERAYLANSFVENLVFPYNEATDDYDSGLVTYHFTEVQKEEYNASGHVSTPYEVSYVSLDININDVLTEDQLPCTTTYQEYHIPEGSTNSHLHTTNGYVNNACEHESDDDTPCTTYTVVTIYCPNSGSSSDGNVTDDNTTTSTSNTSTSGGNTTTNNNDTNDTDTDDTDNVVTSIFTREEVMQQSILECINGLASFNTIDTTVIDPDILTQNELTTAQWLEMYEHLQNNNRSEEAQQEVIDELIEAYDDYKIINELEGKALCVYNKLKKLKGGFKESIKKFDGDFPVAHLKFESTPIDGTAKGATVPPLNGTIANVNSPDYQILIQINSSNNIYGHPQRPNLLIAKTIIHEVIHAEMFRKLLSLAKQGHLDFTDMTAEEQTAYMLSIRENFPGIYDFMRRHKDWQHAQMASHYRKTIARLLQEFDTGVQVPESQEPQLLYMDLAWEGLRYVESPSWGDLPESEKTRVGNVITNYITDNINETCTE